jgi:hypothetical protein
MAAPADQPYAVLLADSYHSVADVLDLVQPDLGACGTFSALVGSKNAYSIVSVKAVLVICSFHCSATSA